MVYPSPFVCMSIIIVNVGIIPNGSCTYPFIISSPISAVMFSVVQTWRNHIESNTIKGILLGVGIPPPHNIQLPNHRTMWRLELQRSKTHTHTHKQNTNTHTPSRAVVWRCGRQRHMGGNNRWAIRVQVLVSILQTEPVRLIYGRQRVFIQDVCPAIRGEKNKGQRSYMSF